MRCVSATKKRSAFDVRFGSRFDAIHRDPFDRSPPRGAQAWEAYVRPPVFAATQAQGHFP
jgi:hypothetical protein